MSDGRPRSRWWPVLLLLLVSAGATAATAATVATRQSGTSTVVATSPRVSVSLPATSTAPATTSTGPQPTLTVGTLPVAPGAPSTAATTTAPPPTTTTTRPPPPPAVPAIRSWPRGHAGYTVVLQSLPEGAGRDAALSQAQRAGAAGIAGAGVLLSSDFASLRAGYWVVFAGDFGSPGAAQSAASADRSRGFPGAYPARVSP